MGQFVEGVITLPFGFRLVAVNRLRPVELRITARDGIAMNIIDVARTIGIDGIRSGERELGERSFEFGEGARAVHREALIEFAALFQLRRAHSYLFAIVRAEDWAVMGFAETV